MVFERYAPGTREHTLAGKPLAGGWKAILFGLIGDLDYFANVLKLASYQRNQDFCNLCQATLLGSTSFTDNRMPGAAWLSTIWSKSSWQVYSGRFSQQAATTATSTTTPIAILKSSIPQKQITN